MPNNRNKERTGGGILVIRGRDEAAAFLKEAQTKRGRIQVAPRADRTMDGIVYASKTEMERHAGLMVLERVGEISNLRRQVTYRIEINGQKICDYIADHVYFDEYEQREIVEDSKGMVTEMFKLKKKLMRAVVGIEVIEV